MKIFRPRIPTLQEAIGNATREDFNRLCCPLVDRTFTVEDLGASWTATRPDLIAITIRSGCGPALRMTRRKILSGRVRRKSKNTS